jgi:hypothetical protein
VALLAFLLSLLFNVGATSADSNASYVANEGTLVAHVAPGETVALRSRPGSRVLARIGAWTEFGSPQALAVVEERGRWLGVTTPALPNGTLGWVDTESAAIGYARAPVSLEADLSRRELVVRVDGGVVRRMRVGIGRPGSPTPTGRFAVTDKLDGADFGRYYGCCIVALSGRQPHLPPGWSGGDRLAIHGGDGAASGAPVSAGCLKASDADLRWLMRRVPLGTQVVIHE